MTPKSSEPKSSAGEGTGRHRITCLPPVTAKNTSRKKITMHPIKANMASTNKPATTSDRSTDTKAARKAPTINKHTNSAQTTANEIAK